MRLCVVRTDRTRFVLCSPHSELLAVWEGHSLSSICGFADLLALQGRGRAVVGAAPCNDVGCVCRSGGWGESAVLIAISDLSE